MCNTHRKGRKRTLTNQLLEAVNPKPTLVVIRISGGSSEDVLSKHNAIISHWIIIQG